VRQWIVDQLRSLSYRLSDLADRWEPEREPTPWDPRFPLLTQFPATMTITDDDRWDGLEETKIWSIMVDDHKVPSAKPE
jgi:hypothetical protein